jgi:hypothetical protein
MSMAGSPAEQPVAGAFGGAVLCNSARAGTASRDGDNVRYVFVPPGAAVPARYALDVEKRSEPVPKALHARFGGEPHAVLRRWTAVETVAKLMDIPSATVMQRLAREKRLDLAAFDIELDGVTMRIERADTSTLFIAIGRRGIA